MEKQNKLLPWIAAFKIFKACTLFMLAFGLHHLRLGDRQSIVEDWIRDVRIDPDDKYAKILIGKVMDLPAHKLHELGVFTCAYAVLFATEGFGLLTRQRWAEYMTVVSTVLFLPLEVYELVDTPHHKWMKAALLLINIWILVYLIMALRRKKTAEATAELKTQSAA